MGVVKCNLNRLKGLDNMAELASCCICQLSLMEAGEETMALLCGHVYHTTCVDTYMRAAHLDQLTLRCPVCKMTSSEAEAKQEVLSEDANAPAMQRPPLQVPLSWTVASVRRITLMRWQQLRQLLKRFQMKPLATTVQPPAAAVQLQSFSCIVSLLMFACSC